MVELKAEEVFPYRENMRGNMACWIPCRRRRQNRGRGFVFLNLSSEIYWIWWIWKNLTRHFFIWLRRFISCQKRSIGKSADFTSTEMFSGCEASAGDGSI